MPCDPAVALMMYGQNGISVVGTVVGCVVGVAVVAVGVGVAVVGVGVGVAVVAVGVGVTVVRVGVGVAVVAVGVGVTVVGVGVGVGPVVPNLRFRFVLPSSANGKLPNPWASPHLIHLGSVTIDGECDVEPRPL